MTQNKYESVVIYAIYFTVAWSTIMEVLVSFLFLNQACTSLWLARTWFLEIVLSTMSVCVCVCPQGYKLHLCDIEPVQPVEQVCCI